MTIRRTLTLTVALAAALGVAGLATPSAADDNKRRVCVNVSDSPDPKEPSPLCVWLPI